MHAGNERARHAPTVASAVADSDAHPPEGPWYGDLDSEGLQNGELESSSPFRGLPGATGLTDHHLVRQAVGFMGGRQNGALDCI